LDPEISKLIKMNIDPPYDRDMGLLKQVSKATDYKKQQCVMKQWSFTMKSGKVIRMRDFCDKILSWTQAFEKAGDY